MYWRTKEYAETYIKNATTNPLRVYVYDEVCKYLIRMGVGGVARLALDAGCGHGVYAKFLLEEGLACEIVLLDFNPYMLKYAAAFLRDFSDTTHLVQADISWLPFRDCAFPLVLAEGDSLTQRESREDVEKSIEEVVRVLRRRGKLIGSVSNLYGRLLSSICKARTPEELDEALGILKLRALSVSSRAGTGIIQLYTPEEFSQALTAKGLVVKSVNPLIVFAHTLPRDMLPKCVETIVRLERRLLMTLTLQA